MWEMTRTLGQFMVDAMQGAYMAVCGTLMNAL